MSVCTCSNPTPAGQQTPDHCGAAAWPLVPKQQRLPRKVFRSSIAWLSDSLRTLRSARHHAPRNTRFQPLVRRYWTGFTPAGFQRKVSDLHPTSHPPSPSFLAQFGRPTRRNMTTVVTQNVIDYVLNPMAASAAVNDQSGLDYPVADPNELFLCCVIQNPVFRRKNVSVTPPDELYEVASPPVSPALGGRDLCSVQGRTKCDGFLCGFVRWRCA